MARKKEFQPDKALEKAMHVFWLQGYKLTSISDLCTAMDIKPGSLYDTFGNKRTLFFKALELYTQHDAPSKEMIEAIDSPLEQIKMIFQTIIDDAINDEQHRGCLIVNTITELAANDEEIKDFGRHHFKMLEDMFYHLLLKAEANGEIAINQDLRAKAKSLCNLLFGLRVMSKVNQNRKDLEDIVNSTLLILS